MRTFQIYEADVRLEDYWASFWQDYEAGTFEPETREQLGRYLRPGSLLVDVGAWIGPVTLWALDMGATVIAVEPDPVALPELKRRTAGKDVEIWAGALSTSDGTVRLAPRFEFGDTMSYVGNGPDSIEVPCWTIQTILADRCPDLVKIDVEGYERELMPTLGPYLASLKVPLVLSLHDIFPLPQWFHGYTEARLVGTPIVEVK